MDKIRDLRDKGKYVINDRYIDEYARLCGIYATGVYNSLCRHANKKQTCFPSKKLIAKELKISERKVYDALKALVNWNIIRIENQGRKGDGSYRNKLYILLDISQWNSVQSVGYAVGIKENKPQAGGANDLEQDMPNKETQYKEGNTDKETQSLPNSSFIVFWEEYPRKEGRKKAEQIWNRKKLSTSLSAILAFIEGAKKTDRWIRGFIKQPHSFLHEECWNDDLTGYGEIKIKQSNILPAPKNKYENYK